MTDQATAEAPKLSPLSFDRLSGWARDDHAAAFHAFRLSAAIAAEHPPKERGIGLHAAALAAILARSLKFSGEISRERARSFFESTFTPVEIVPASGGGFFTGYYEPVVAGSRQRGGTFQTPLYGVPDDLVEFDPAASPEGLDPTLRFARKTEAGLVAYHDRAAIEAGALAGKGLELVFLADPVDAFFIHVQGAARIELAEGGTMRVTYAAKSGHPYTPIGRVLIEKGALEKGKATMQAIRAWLAAHPDAAAGVMQANRSFIFFREAPVEDPRLGPVAAAKAPLTGGRSLAVDRLLHTFHAPVWIETTLADRSPWHRLMIAQDTGSAIVGAARGDIFFGSGDEAGAVAGGMAAGGRFVLLVPRGSRLAGAAP